MNKKPKFNIADYPGKYVMHVSNEEQSKIFCNYLHSLGRTWFSGRSYKHSSHYGLDGADIYYAFNSNVTGGRHLCKELDYIFLEFEDFDWEE